jgi:outer membrane protein assembly factor BamB
MSVGVPVSSGPRRTFFRFWFPILVVAGAALGAAGVWYWPAPEWEFAQRVSTLILVGMVTTLLLALWLLFLSGFAWWVRLGFLVLVVGTVLALVREVRFSGDMVPIFFFRTAESADDLLERQRKEQAGNGSGPEVPSTSDSDSGPVFPGYRGRRRDGVVTDTRLHPDWTAQAPRQLWRQPVGGGYAGFAVLAGRAVTIEQRREEEAVVCYDAASGHELWAHRYAAHFKEPLGGPGPRATPTIAALADEPASLKVFSLGATGRLVCLDLKTGQAEWSVDILKRPKEENLQWGMAGSPLVLDNVVIVTPGVQGDAAPGRAVVALDARTGKELWAGGNHHGGYSSPMVADLAGRKQLLVLDGEGLTSYDPADGQQLWHHAWPTYQNINVAQPLVLDGDRVFISAGYSKGCAMLQVTRKGPPQVLWENLHMRCKFTSPVHRDGFLYGLDEGILTCLDAASGRRRWKEGRYGHGQVLLVNEQLLLLSEAGDLVLVEATPEGFRERGKMAALAGKTWNTHAFSAGRAFVRNDREMACYELPGERAQPAAAGPAPRD